MGQMYSVVILQGNLRHTTQAKPGPEAIYNEPVSLTIENEFQNLVIQIEQATTKRVLLKNEISFEDINDPQQTLTFKNYQIVANENDPQSTGLTISLDY